MAPTARVLFCAFYAAVSVTVAAGEDVAPQVSFVRNVAPILVSKCQACHGPKAVESNYRVDAFHALMQAGDHGMPPIVAGNLEESELYRLITSDDAEERMPNNGGRLTTAEITTIATWIQQGAQFDGLDAQSTLTTQIPRDLPYPTPPQLYPSALPISGLALTADGSRLISGGYYELLIWDVAKGTLLARTGDVPQRTFGVAFDPEGRLLAVAGGSPGVSGDVRLIPWEDASSPPGGKPTVLAKLEDVFFDVAFRPNGREVAACAADGTIRVFDVATASERLKIEAHADWINAICYSTDGALIASASRDKTAKVFNADSGALVAAYSEHEVPVRAIAFAADGKSVLTAGGSSVHLWNVEDARRLGDVSGFAGEVNALTVHGETAVAASAGGSIRHFRVANRELIREFSHRSKVLLSLGWSQRPDRICLGCLDGTVSLWDLDTGSMEKEFSAWPTNGDASH